MKSQISASVPREHSPCLRSSIPNLKGCSNQARRAARPARPGASPGPTLSSRSGSGHRKQRKPCAMLALVECPFGTCRIRPLASPILPSHRGIRASRPTHADNRSMGQGSGLRAQPESGTEPGGALQPTAPASPQRQVQSFEKATPRLRALLWMRRQQFRSDFHPHQRTEPISATEHPGSVRPIVPPRADTPSPVPPYARPEIRGPRWPEAHQSAGLRPQPLGSDPQSQRCQTRPSSERAATRKGLLCKDQAHKSGTFGQKSRPPPLINLDQLETARTT